MTTLDHLTASVADTKRTSTATYLEDRCKHLGISPRDAADQLNISVTAWTQTLKGRMKVTFDRIEPIAQLLQVSAHDFFSQVLTEYSPALMELLARLNPASVVTASEMSILQQLRGLGLADRTMKAVPLLNSFVLTEVVR